MKISFLFPLKQKHIETGEVRTTVKKVWINMNEKFIYETEVNQIKWRLINCLKIQSLVLIGELRGKNYWCNTIPFSMVYKKFPVLKGNANNFNKAGFHKRILEGIFKNLNLRQSLDHIDKISFNSYVNTEYKSEPQD